ncbi:MAG: efflux RND transporter periplasmic adaptor subunit [Pseudomonadota bacterium]
MTAQMSLSRQVLLLGLLVLIAAGAWGGRGPILDAFGLNADPSERTERSARPATRVVTVGVVLKPDDLTLEAVGTGRAVRSVTLRTESAGKIVSMALAAGQRFEAGDALLTLDDAHEQLALSLAQARLAEARRDLERSEQLQGRGVAAVATLDQVRTATEVAEIEVAIARERLEDRTLRAPFEGVASIAEVEIGDWIDTDDVVARFDDRRTLLIEFDAPELLLPRIEVGMRVAVVSPTAPGAEIVGEVVAIDSRIDPTSRAARVRIAAPNEADRLRPGASFTVRLDLPGERYPLAPELALQFERTGLHVWRAVDGKAEKVPVTLIRRRVDGVLVDADLREGDRIVVEGAQRLSPGRAIEIATDPAGRP